MIVFGQKYSSSFFSYEWKDESGKLKTTKNRKQKVTMVLRRRNHVTFFILWKNAKEEMKMADAKIEFLFLNEEDMINAGVTDMGRCVEVMTEMFELLGKGDYIMGSKNHNSHGIMIDFPEHPQFAGMPATGPDRRFMAMPSYLGGRFQICGEKWYGSNKENIEKGLPRSILMYTLNDKDTGAPLAYMSANLLSAIRTGAVPGVAAKFLARKDASVASIIGPGVMGKTGIRAVLEAVPGIKTVKVCGRRRVTSEKFVEYMKQYFPEKEYCIVDTHEEAARDSDIICVATSGAATDPELKEEWLKKGALLLLPATIHLDDDFILNRAVNVVDNWKMWECWEDEYQYSYYEKLEMLGAYYLDLMHDGKMKREQIIEMGDIVAGKTAGRRSEDDIVLFTTGGMPVEDAAWGCEIYRNALKKGIGTKLKLWDSPAMA